MAIKCPNTNCRSDEIKKQLYFDGAETNIDNVGHYHLLCLVCGRQFNHWNCGFDKIKEIFGKDAHMYV